MSGKIFDLYAVCPLCKQPNNEARLAVLEAVRVAAAVMLADGGWLDAWRTRPSGYEALRAALDAAKGEP